MRRNKHNSTRALVAAGLGLCSATAHAATIDVYADDDAGFGGSGTSTNPYRTLQRALIRAVVETAAGNDVAIHVAAGLYRPDAGPGVTTGDRYATFTMLDDVTIRGGYDSSFTFDPHSNATILSGNIGMLGVDTDNSYHVVTASGVGATAVLEHVTIQNGYADLLLTWEQSAGGLLVRLGAAPVISSCILRDNYAAVSGGAVLLAEASNPQFTDCRFTGNTALVESGAVDIAFSLGSFEGCIFSGNTSPGGSGGAVRMTGATPLFRDCSLFNNTSGGDGGAATIVDGSSPEFRSCTFTSNTATADGGAIWDERSGTSIFAACRFVDNQAAAGGAVATSPYDWPTSRPAIVSCLFRSNTATVDGGAILSQGDIHLVNNVFETNQAGAQGGALVQVIVAPADEVANNTFYDNTAGTYGGAIYTDVPGWTVASSILWNDSPDEIYSTVGILPFLEKSDITGGWAGLSVYGGNISTDPMFVDAPAGDFRLQSSSPCIDTGENALIPPDWADIDEDGWEDPVPLDFLLADRIVDAVVDMGAIETPPPPSPTADLDGDGSVGFSDLIILLAAWGPCPPDAECPADLDLDGSVGFGDILVILGEWGDL